MIIEAQDGARSRIETLLSKKGFLIHCFDTASAGIEALKNAGTTPYALVISSYAMPKMKGDEILLKALEISRTTTRILMANTDDIDTLANAINTAQVHSCLTLPFEEHDLVSQAENCCAQFETTLKLENLKHTTQRQNRQLFQIASRFKKQEAADLARREDLKNQIRILESKLKAGKGDANPDKIPALKEIMETKEIEFSSQGFGKEFIKMKAQFKQILETALIRHSINLGPLYYRDIIYRVGQEKEYHGLVEKLMPMAQMLFHQSNAGGMNLFGKDFKQYMDKHFQLTLSSDRVKAFIKIKKMEKRTLDLTFIKYFLFWHNVTYGVTDDQAIKAWLSSASENTPPFVVAHGFSPVLSKDAVIKYHFPTDFRHAGKVSEDGSINFRDRGEIPFTSENAFLAAKIPPEQGKPGIDVTGNEIPVKEPGDRTFEAGPGTRLSEDGNKIYAQIEGQPHLDAMGKITVCPELKIQGDLGFETGDIIFDGNVVVDGTIKQGFKVKGASLTAREIEGAQIDLTGDLNVSLGIIDAELVNVKGSVQAKFIRNSKINAFGDLIVQREIMDSNIRLSGACINTSGVIIASEISANMGVDAGDIGTDTSGPSKLLVGVDEHTNILVAKVEANKRTHFEATAQLKKEISDLEKEDINLHGLIAKYAHVQDRAQLDLKNIEQKIGGLKASGNMAVVQKVTQAAKQIREEAKQAEEKINAGFERQDALVQEISQKQARIKQFEDLNLILADEKKRLLEFTARKKPLPQVKVGKKIKSGTRISGPNSSITLHKSDVRCRIAEMKKNAEETKSIALYEMKITS
jgi:uncharacterized protein (DUF342 family)/DNA-binding NarL/FixJ family response regulator